jgi:hypothetical protein
MRSFLYDSNNSTAANDEFLTDDGGGVIWTSLFFTGTHKSWPSDNTINYYKDNIENYIGKIVTSSPGYTDRSMNTGISSIDIMDT